MDDRRSQSNSNDLSKADRGDCRGISRCRLLQGAGEGRRVTTDDVPTPDDPDDASTQLILDAIAEFTEGVADPAAKVRATFFVISSHLADAARSRTHAGAGHEIGNHGTSTALRRPCPSRHSEQALASHQRLTSFTDQPIRWFRPGRGLFTQAMLAALRKMEGYEPRFALASMLPVDTFRPADDPRFTAWYVRQHIFPGSILLLHGGTPLQSQQTVAALKLILPELQQRGYRVTTQRSLDPADENARRAVSGQRRRESREASGLPRRGVVELPGVAVLPGAPARRLELLAAGRTGGRTHTGADQTPAGRR